MVAHSSDTIEFVDVVKDAVALFCNEYNKYNQKSILLEVKDFNDAVFSIASNDETQEVVFEQFAARPDIVIVLVGERLGDGLKKELESFTKENKQVFLYLYDGGFRVYKEWHSYEERLKKFKEDMDEVYQKFHNKGFAKIFANREELISHIMNDLGRYIKHRHKVRYELADKSYNRFAFDEVDRYRKEIHTLINEVKEARTMARAAEWIEDHSKTNILELLRMLRSLLAEEYDLDIDDITVSFVWGYHNPEKENEIVIWLDPQNVISLNHSGTPAKLSELIQHQNSLLRYMIVNGITYKWYQYKSYACMKGRYWWPETEKSEKDKCMRRHSSAVEQAKERMCFGCKNSDKNRTNSNEDQFGGSIFCYKIALNGDGAKTNNYVLSYIMVSTYRKPFTNTTHGVIRDEVEQRIKNMIDYRIKPQLLVELSQLYIAYLYKKPHISDAPANNDYQNAYKSIEKEIQGKKMEG